MSLKQILKAADRAAALEQGSRLEGEIREFVRRDVAPPRQQRDEADAASHPGAEILKGLIQRVAGASTEEIDQVILELQNVREMLNSEGKRLSREIAGYANLNHAAVTAMKVIGDNLKKWKDVDQTTATGETPTDHAGEHVIALPSP